MKIHKVRLVLVESKESTLHLSHGKLLITSIKSTGKSDLYKSIPQELILISLENEKIEEGDWKYNPKLNEIWQHNRKNKGLSEELQNTISNETAKVIAHQSQISPEYISKFIEQYNNGCVEDLAIEMETKTYQPCDNNYEKCGEPFNIDEPKLTNGFVTVIEKPICERT